MEAKDVKWCPQHGYPLPCNKCGMPLSQVDQREIFKAGMREVVEWVERALFVHPDNRKPLIQEWQAKLKEWGIE